MGVNVDCMDKVFGKSSNKKERLSLLQETRILKKRLEQLDREKEKIVRRLGRLT